MSPVGKAAMVPVARESTNTAGFPPMILGCYCKECRGWVLNHGSDRYICTNEEAPCYLEATLGTFGCTLGVRHG